MASKNRTQIPRPPTRKRKPSVRPVPPRPKGELERLAVRRLAAMRYRLAGATYSVIAEKLTEDRAREYADAHGISIDRAMKKIPHVSKRTAWDDMTTEWEELRRETEVQRADLMALENARLDQVFSKALSLFANGSVPAGRLAIATMGRRCLFVAGSLPVRVPQRAGVEVRGARFVRGVAFGSESVPRSLGVGHSAYSASSKPRPTDTFGRPRVRRSRPPSSERPCGRFSSCRASMTSVVDAPRAVSSDASPTRPLCAVTRASMPAARAAAVNRR